MNKLTQPTKEQVRQYMEQRQAANPPAADKGNSVPAWLGIGRDGATR